MLRLRKQVFGDICSTYSILLRSYSSFTSSYSSNVPSIAPTKTILPRPSPTFSELHVSKVLETCLTKLKLVSPTLIQAAAIPHLVRRPWDAQAYPDVLIEDLTGQGKTLSYLLPILSQLDRPCKLTQALIVVPSRELGVQVSRTIEELIQGMSNSSKSKHPIVVNTLAGDENPYVISMLTRAAKFYEDEIHIRKGGKNKSKEHEVVQDHGNVYVPYPQILICTPSILSSIISRKILNLSHLKYIVYDEIDQLLNSSYHKQHIIPILAARDFAKQEAIKSGVKELNQYPRTQVVLVSATMTSVVHTFAQTYLAANKVFITPASIPEESERRGRDLSVRLPERIKHLYLFVNRGLSRDKCLPLLLNSIKHGFNKYRLTLPQTANAFHMKKSNIKTYISKRDKEISRGAGYMGGKYLRAGLQSVDIGNVGKSMQCTAVFFNTKNILNTFVPLLSQWGHQIGVISETSSRSERRDALKLHSTEVLLSTDLLSRGMDVKTLSHIINYEVPSSTNIYIHRSGRVGRLSALHANHGTVITLLDGLNAEEIDLYKKHISSLGGKIKASRVFIGKNKELRVDTSDKWSDITSMDSKSIVDNHLKQKLIYQGKYEELAEFEAQRSGDASTVNDLKIDADTDEFWEARELSVATPKTKSSNGLKAMKRSSNSNIIEQVDEYNNDVADPEDSMDHYSAPLILAPPVFKTEKTQTSPVLAKHIKIKSELADLKLSWEEKNADTHRSDYSKVVKDINLLKNRKQM